MDSDDYRERSNEVVKLLDEAVSNLDANFTSLFTAVVNRMNESIASDDWFSDVAALYASYITTAILGKKYERPKVKMNTASNPETGSGGSTPTPVEYSKDSVESVSPIETLSDESSTIDISKYQSKPESGFVVTTDNPTYELSNDDLDILTAIVSAESDKSYDDALAVVSTILNRCEEPNWASCGGANPVKQATAPGQFSVYQSGSYKSFLGSSAPDTVREAVMDALNGTRNHDYLSFRSNSSSGFSSNMITSSGNRYK